MSDTRLGTLRERNTSDCATEHKGRERQETTLSVRNKPSILQSNALHTPPAVSPVTAQKYTDTCLRRHDWPVCFRNRQRASLWPFQHDKRGEGWFPLRGDYFAPRVLFARARFQNAGLQ
jgi:hypothetical protein